MGIVGVLRRFRRPTATSARHFRGQVQAGAENDVVVVASVARGADARRVDLFRSKGDGIEGVALGGDGADSRFVLELIVYPSERSLRAFMDLIEG